jgi:hypothetical protein
MLQKYISAAHAHAIPAAHPHRYPPAAHADDKSCWACSPNNLLRMLIAILLDMLTQILLNNPAEHIYFWTC